MTTQQTTHTIMIPVQQHNGETQNQPLTVSADTYRKFKRQAQELGLTVGQAATRHLSTLCQGIRSGKLSPHEAAGIKA